MMPARSDVSDADDYIVPSITRRALPSRNLLVSFGAISRVVGSSGMGVKRRGGGESGAGYRRPLGKFLRHRGSRFLMIEGFVGDEIIVVRLGTVLAISFIAPSVTAALVGHRLARLVGAGYGCLSTRLALARCRRRSCRARRDAPRASLRLYELNSWLAAAGASASLSSNTHGVLTASICSIIAGRRWIFRCKRRSNSAPRLSATRSASASSPRSFRALH